MHPTPRLRVLSDRISRVLVFVYFYRGLSGIMEERLTRRIYIEILRCHTIILHLEESRSHGNERETGRARGQGARPPLLGAHPGLGANQNQTLGSCSTDLKDQGKPCDQCRFDPTAQIHLRRLYKQGLSTLGGERRNHYERKPSKLGFRTSLPQRIRISYSLNLQVL